MERAERWNKYFSEDLRIRQGFKIPDGKSQRAKWDRLLKHTLRITDAKKQRRWGNSLNAFLQKDKSRPTSKGGGNDLRVLKGKGSNFMPGRITTETNRVKMHSEAHRV